MPGKHHDLIRLTKEYKGALHSFFLDMSSWRKFKTGYNLVWKQEPFEAASEGQIPEERGIYAFTIEAKGMELPVHGYILYMGITGDTAPDRNLRKRFGDYLADLRREGGRPAVYYMLGDWVGNLQFNYVALPNPAIDLERIEEDFLQAIIPPINKRDLGAEITAIKAAAF